MRSSVVIVGFLALGCGEGLSGTPTEQLAPNAGSTAPETSPLPMGARLEYVFTAQQGLSVTWTGEAHRHRGAFRATAVVMPGSDTVREGAMEFDPMPFHPTFGLVARDFFGARGGAVEAAGSLVASVEVQIAESEDWQAAGHIEIAPIQVVALRTTPLEPTPAIAILMSNGQILTRLGRSAAWTPVEGVQYSARFDLDLGIVTAPYQGCVVLNGKESIACWGFNGVDGWPNSPELLAEAQPQKIALADPPARVSVGGRGPCVSNESQVQCFGNIVGRSQIVDADGMMELPEIETLHDLVTSRNSVCIVATTVDHTRRLFCRALDRDDPWFVPAGANGQVIGGLVQYDRPSRGGGGVRVCARFLENGKNTTHRCFTGDHKHDDAVRAMPERPWLDVDVAPVGDTEMGCKLSNTIEGTAVECVMLPVGAAELPQRLPTRDRRTGQISASASAKVDGIRQMNLCNLYDDGLIQCAEYHRTDGVPRAWFERFEILRFL